MRLCGFKSRSGYCALRSLGEGGLKKNKSVGRDSTLCPCRRIQPGSPGYRGTRSSGSLHVSKQKLKKSYKKNHYFVLLLLICNIAFIQSCEEGQDPPPTPPPPPPGVVYDYKSEKAHNLNIVYFVPADADKPADYHRRLSEILLSFQDYFGNEMERNGYGYKTLGLLKDDAKKRVKLIEITGTNGKVAYPSGSHDAIIAEINNYRATHASDFTSEHYLVILPASSYDGSGSPGGVPFYGLGKFCFALDYADQDIKHLGTGSTLGERATIWIGGMLHELGHGLNLSHNRQKFTSEGALGMALMWAGNYTWGKSPTFLTEADCAVLNTNQIFNTGINTYYGTSNASLQTIHASYDAEKAAIIVNGKFVSSVPVTDIVCFNDPNVANEGYGINKDYNAIAWASKPINPDSFFIEMPIADLEYKADYVPYELKVKLVQDRGNIIEIYYSYTFLAGVPVLNIDTRDETSKQGWRIVSFSSEETSGEGDINGRATALIDGNVSTFWHSRWTSDATIYPHQLVIDMGDARTLKGLSIVQRGGLARAIKNAELLTSSDGINFTSAGSFVFAEANGPQYFDFSSAMSFRYYKVIARSAWDGLQFAALAEVGMY